MKNDRRPEIQASYVENIQTEVEHAMLNLMFVSTLECFFCFVLFLQLQYLQSSQKLQVFMPSLWFASESDSTTKPLLLTTAVDA